MRRLEAHRQAMYGAEERKMVEALKTAMAPDDVARLAIDAIRAEKLYIFTDPSLRDAIRLRWENILHEREPWAGSAYEEPAD